MKRSRRGKRAGTAVLAAGILLTSAIPALAATYKANQAVDTTMTFKNLSFVARQYRVGYDYQYKLLMTKNGKTSTIATRTTCAFVSNGSVLYYVKRGKSPTQDYSFKNTIYRYLVKTGKKTRLASGKDYTVVQASKNYLYMGNDENADGVRLYAYNLKTKKKRFMRSTAGKVCVGKTRVAADTNSGAVGNYPIYTFTLSGTGRIRIANGILLKAKGNQVYYYRYQNSGKFRVYRCDWKGKHKKAVTGWVNEIPAEYLRS